MKTTYLLLFFCSFVFAEGLIPLPGKWLQGPAHGVSKLYFDGTRVVGMELQMKDAKKYDYAARRVLNPPIAGNILLTAKLEYKTKAKGFIGNVHLRLLNAQGEVIAAAGLRDHWEAYPGIAYGQAGASATGKPTKYLPLDGAMALKIERTDGTAIVNINGEEILSAKTSTEPVNQIVLFFEEYNNPESLAGEFEFKDIQIESTGIPEGYIAHFQDSSKPQSERKTTVTESDKSVMPLPGYWTQGFSKHVSGLTFSGNAVTGIVKEGTTAPFYYSADCALLPSVTGDFIATAKLKYAMDAEFTGEIHLILLDTNDGQLAAMGLRDRWANKDFAHIYASFLETGTVSSTSVPIKGVLNMRIERDGNVISLFDNEGKLIAKQEGSTMPVAKVRLYFQEYPNTIDKKYSFEFADIKILAKDGSNVGEVFEEFPVRLFSNGWKTTTMSGAEGLDIDEAAPFLTVKGFKKPNLGEKKAYRAVLDHDIAPVKGDFTATIDMTWDMPMVFVGDVLFQMLNAKNEIIAEAGIVDDTPKGAIRMGAWTSPRRGQAMTGKNKDAGTFFIQRKNGKCFIFFDDWPLEEIECTSDAIERIRLVFKQTMYFHQDEGPNLTEFGKVSFKRIAVTRKVLPHPEFKVARQPRPRDWQMGRPIVWYWAGPDITEDFARELADGGWNTAWCVTPQDLDIVYRHGLRGVCWMTIDPINEDNIRRLTLWLNSIRNHPALYGIHCNDEPGGPRMPAAELKVNFMRKTAPELLHFNNMHPLGAENYHLGHEGKPTVAYDAYIDEYCTKLYCQLLSYDKYTFSPWGDDASFFANLAMVRKAALQRNIPMMSIIQACTWCVWRRIPNANEVRYLTYAILAYGAQGVSHYVYGVEGHDGAMQYIDSSKTTPLYDACRTINREFFAIASELQGLKSIEAYHTGEIPFMAATLPDNGIFQLEPKLANKPQNVTDAETRKADGKNFFSNLLPVKGFILGYFGKDGKATHVLVVNLDYNATAKTRLTASAPLQRFAPHQALWVDCNANYADLELPPGGGILFRIKN